jgi:hypothetical protein
MDPKVMREPVHLGQDLLPTMLLHLSSQPLSPTLPRLSGFSLKIGQSLTVETWATLLPSRGMDGFLSWTECIACLAHI